MKPRKKRPKQNPYEEPPQMPKIDEMISADEEPKKHVIPERSLLACMLQRAILDYLAPPRPASEKVFRTAYKKVTRLYGREYLREEARRWLFEPMAGETSDSPFSFLWVCRELGFNAQAFRDSLSKFKSMAATTRHGLTPEFYQ